MVDIEVWMGELAEKLTGRFGDRLLFLGLQGSYGRGEAGEDSDIDVVTVLNRVELADLDEYRAAVRGMPEGEKACGFLCGAAELKSWPKYDLCQLARDVRAYRGELGPLLPPLGREDLTPPRPPPSARPASITPQCTLTCTRPRTIGPAF